MAYFTMFPPVSTSTARISSRALRASSGGWNASLTDVFAASLFCTTVSGSTRSCPLRLRALDTAVYPCRCPNKPLSGIHRAARSNPTPCTRSKMEMRGALYNQVPGYKKRIRRTRTTRIVYASVDGVSVWTIGRAIAGLRGTVMHSRTNPHHTATATTHSTHPIPRSYGTHS